MTRQEFLNLSDLDKVKHAIEESLKDHEGWKSNYWKGSSFMGQNILQTIQQIKDFASNDISASLCFDKGYLKGYNDATIEACKEISKNY